MNLLYHFFLYSHILFGGTALILGMVAILSKKGLRFHKSAGRIYVIAMCVVVVSAIVLSIIKTNHFLLSIAVFSFYLTYTGYRAIKNKRYIAQWYDWLIIIINSLTSIWMISTLDNVLIVFGSINILMSARDIYVFVKQKEYILSNKTHWIKTHIGRMMGAFIATTTAFIVVNIQMTPCWIPWLAPTALGVPIIFYFTNKYKK